MLEARKDNKIYRINGEEKEGYLKDGYDIYEDGKVIEYTPKKVIAYTEHLKLLNSAIKEKDEEINRLKAETKQSAENVMELLKQYAIEKSIDIGSVTSPTGVLNKILEVEKE